MLSRSESLSSMRVSGQYNAAPFDGFETLDLSLGRADTTGLKGATSVLLDHSYQLKPLTRRGTLD